MTSDSEHGLEEQVREALRLADALGLDEVAIHLNDALIALVGEGVAPPEPTPFAIH